MHLEIVSEIYITNFYKPRFNTKLSYAMIALLALALLPALALASSNAKQSKAASRPSPISTNPSSDVYIDLSNRVGNIHVVKREGDLYILLDGSDGNARRLTSKQYISALYHEQIIRNSNKLFLVFNITTWVGVLWVALGLLGQIAFTGRMVVQWLVSEKEKKSVVPVMFWWMSMCGASMLLTYFIWRKDIVGVIGQSTGWAIYARNLWMIYLRK